jgi:AcrR family transcriptional regulator
MHERARSIEDKTQRSEDLLEAAEALAVELGGVRFVTLAPVTERAGLHRTGVRRYYASKEELLLELAERGWRQWSDAVKTAIGDRAGLGPREVATAMSETLASMPVFCDLLTHVAVSLEGDVDIERARRYKTNSFAAHDEMVSALDHASDMTADQIRALVAAAQAFAATFWQISHPTPTLAALYEQVPAWGHVALDFAPRLRLLLEATAVGLVETLPPNDRS